MLTREDIDNCREEYGEVEDFYKNNRSNKVKIMSRILRGDVASAEDVVQEAFCRALKYYDSFDESRGTMDKWFNSIMFNCLRDYQQETHNHAATGSKDINPEDVLVELDLNSEYDRNVLIPSLIEEITNETHQRVLHLFFRLGYNSAEISQIEEKISSSNVTTIISRFKKKVMAREMLKYPQEMEHLEAAQNNLKELGGSIPNE